MSIPLALASSRRAWSPESILPPLAMVAFNWSLRDGAMAAMPAFCASVSPRPAAFAASMASCFRAAKLFGPKLLGRGAQGDPELLVQVHRLLRELAGHTLPERLGRFLLRRLDRIALEQAHDGLPDPDGRPRHRPDHADGAEDVGQL